MSHGDVATWPAWSRLQLEHKRLLDSLASPDPYCDWTFATLWSSDTEEAVALARLGDGFALRLPSYPLGGPEDFSLNGRPSAVSVSAFVAEHRDVSLVPKPVVEGLGLTDCVVSDDRDQYDYVYDVTESLGMAGGQFRTARYALRKAIDRNVGATTSELDLSDSGVVSEVLELFEAWASAREVDASAERRALARCLEIADLAEVGCASVTGPNGLLAFALLAPQPGLWTGLPFAKRHPDASDVGGLLWRSVLECADARGLRWINQEQDLGMPGLRQHKTSLGPARMLEKVRLDPVTAE
jgi:hypothetical protein